MKTLGSHPGAILFRLSIMIILIATLTVIFFSYVDDTEKELERTSIAQTEKIINSALVLVFATYAANSRLDELNELVGGNPFEFLQEYKILPPAYQGAIDSDLNAGMQPGWYYLGHRGQVAYKPFYNDNQTYYAVNLNYEDTNLSGRFEPGPDRFEGLVLERILSP